MKRDIYIQLVIFGGLEIVLYLLLLNSFGMKWFIILSAYGFTSSIRGQSIGRLQQLKKTNSNEHKS